MQLFKQRNSYKKKNVDEDTYYIQGSLQNGSQVDFSSIEDLDLCKLSINMNNIPLPIYPKVYCKNIIF